MAKDIIAEMAGTCVLMRSRLISRVMTGIYDEALRPFGSNAPQFALLLVMASLGPSSRAAIGRFHHQDRSTLTRNLALMIAAGWAEEVPDAVSGKGRYLVVTKAGRDLLQRAAPAWRGAQARARAMIGTDGVAAVTKIADAMLAQDGAA
jgi:DNA-binding MarR family transcriptional regulator